MNYAQREAKRIGLQREIEATENSSVFQLYLRNSAAIALREQNRQRAAGVWK